MLSTDRLSFAPWTPSPFAESGGPSLRRGFPVARVSPSTHAELGDRLDGSEGVRLAALWDLDLLDSGPETVYDDITRAAAEICDTPIALISLVDRHRQWFKSRFGWSATETPREHAFCALTIQHRDRATVINDASLEDRFAGNPLVHGDAQIRFYAGIPLVTAGEQAVGALCVMDRRPRRLEATQIAKLRYLGSRVMALFGQRRTALAHRSSN